MSGEENVPPVPPRDPRIDLKRLHLNFSRFTWFAAGVNVLIGSLNLYTAIHSPSVWDAWFSGVSFGVAFMVFGGAWGNGWFYRRTDGLMQNVFNAWHASTQLLMTEIFNRNAVLEAISKHGDEASRSMAANALSRSMFTSPAEGDEAKTKH